MRSKTLLAALLFTGCATPAAKQACYPVASWSAPVLRCAAPAAPPPVVEAKPEPEPAKPEPAPEPAPEPEPAPPVAKLADDKIDLSESVQFDEDSSNLVERSKTLLDDVVRELGEHPEVTRIQIEGHTDSLAGPKHNMKLSKDRVESVKAYLIEKGVAPKRIVTKAFGESKPIADNKTDEGRAKNRRVDFRVLKKKK
jgi:outer membrane protein OmpA-like peptidoglycan-associated protein